MKAIRYIIKLTALAVAVSLPCSLMAGPTVIRIDGSNGNSSPTVEVLNSEEYNLYKGPLVSTPADEFGALVNLLGADNVYLGGFPWTGLIADREWRFTDPNAPAPTRAAVYIVWIDHDYADDYNGYYGPLWSGDLRVGYNKHKPGAYYGNGGASNAGPVQDKWLTLYADDTLVLQFKGGRREGKNSN